MKLFESFKKIFVAPEELYEEDIEVDEEPINEPVRNEPRRTQQRTTETRRPAQSGGYANTNTSVNNNTHTSTSVEGKGRIVSMYGESNLKISVERPKRYDDLTKIADKMKDGYTIILNTEDVDDVLKQRLGDFIGGAAYVIDGDMRTAADGVLVVSPQNVKVDGDFLNTMGSLGSMGSVNSIGSNYI